MSPSSRTFAARHAVGLGLALAVVSAMPRPAAAEAPALKLPPFERVTLDNGLVVLLMEQHEVPLLSVQLVVKAGAASDPRGKEGLANVTAGLLRRGTARRSGDELAETLDGLGAELGGGAGYELSSLDAEVLAKDADVGMALMAEMVLRPAFPADELSKRLSRQIDRIRRAKDEPRAVLGRYAATFFYGPGHPYGRPAGGDELSLKAIERADVVQFHAQRWVPGNAMLAMVGDLPKTKMLELARKHFGPWPSAPVPPQPLPPQRAHQGARVLLVDKPDAPQAHFAMLAPGLDRRHADRTGVKVVNTVLGGSFTSWLMTKLRVEAGLTYGAGSGFRMRSQPGHFSISSFTETPNTEQAITLAVAQLERLHGDGPTTEELAGVRAYVKGQFPPSLETSDQLADLLTTLEYYGLGRDEVDGFMARVDAVQPAIAKRLIQERFPQPKDLVYVIIGKAAELRPLAKKLGEVSEKKIGDPGF